MFLPHLSNLRLFNTPIRLYIIALVVLVLSACSGDQIEVTAKFDNTRDIKEGSSVYLQQSPVGKVVDVSGHQSGSVVKIAITPDAAAKIHTDAAVVVNRIKPGAPLEIHNPNGPVTQPLQAGQTINAMDSMLELMAWSVGDAINTGGKEFTSMIGSFQNYLKGEEFQQSKREFQQQMQQAADAAGSALETLGQDLSESIDDLVASEDQMIAAIEDLGDELSPVVEELAKSSTELALQMEEFAHSLENATPEEQASGQRLMDSMAELLEQLNDSIERGAKNAEVPE